MLHEILCIVSKAASSIVFVAFFHRNQRLLLHFSICWDFFIWQQKAYSFATRVSCRDWRNGGNEWEIAKVTKRKKEAKKCLTANRSAEHGLTQKIDERVRGSAYDFIPPSACPVRPGTSFFHFQSVKIDLFRYPSHGFL